MNPFRNEMKITLGTQEILLRPTFENIAAMEQAVATLSYLGWRFSRGSRLSFQAKQTNTQVSLDEMVKSMPSLSECAQIIFYNQATPHPEDPMRKQFSLEEIWDLVQQEGATVINPVVAYISRITAGKTRVDDVKAEDESVKT